MKPAIAWHPLSKFSMFTCVYFTYIAFHGVFPQRGNQSFDLLAGKHERGNNFQGENQPRKKLCLNNVISVHSKCIYYTILGGLS